MGAEAQRPQMLQRVQNPASASSVKKPMSPDHIPQTCGTSDAFGAQTHLAPEAPLANAAPSCPPPAHRGSSAGTEHQERSWCRSNRLSALLDGDANTNLVCSEMTTCQENPALETLKL